MQLFDTSFLTGDFLPVQRTGPRDAAGQADAQPVCLAEQKCRQRNRDFAELFRNQYVLNRDARRSYPGWHKRTLFGWTLHHGVALEVKPILDAGNRQVGFLLGQALLPDSTLVRDALRLDRRRDDPDFGARAEALFTELAGRYLVVLLTPTLKRLYADPVCDIPVLFDTETGQIASSLGLVIDRDIRPNRGFPAKMVLTGQRTLGLQNTLDATVKRAVSNHFLDLDALTLHRHWPPEAAVFDVSPRNMTRFINRRLDELVDRLGGHIASLTDAYDCVLPVTGGRDSRMLIACGKDALDNVVEFCGHRFHNQSRRDIIQGRRVVRSQGYGYTQYFKKDATREQMRDMRLKMGWSGTRGELAALAMLEEYPRNHMVLRGNIMELLRANQWRNSLIDRPMEVAPGLRRLKVRPDATRKAVAHFGANYLAWWESLPENARCRAYDFGFVEQFLPNIQGPYITAMHRTPFMNPFNDRRLIEIAISMPTGMRKDGTIVNSILQRAAPELLQMPFV